MTEQMFNVDNWVIIATKHISIDKSVFKKKYYRHFILFSL